MRFQRHHGVKIAILPRASGPTNPVPRVLGVLTFLPKPALSRPEFLAPVSAIVHKLLVLLVRHRRVGYLEGRKLHHVAPLLVIEDERHLVRDLTTQDE